MRTKLLTACLIIFTFSLIILPTSILARNPIPPSGNYTEDVFTPAINSPDVNLQSTVFEIYLSIISSMNSQMFCVNNQCPNISLNNNQNAQSSFNTEPRLGGLIPGLLQANSTFLDQRPISSTEYIADVRDHLNLGASPAYAQGIGFQGLQPIYGLWEAFRNIAYLLASIGFIFLAFMVMFRIRAGSQTVLTAQSSIIKFIVVILAITFSYPIAGFIIDLIYLFSSFIIMLFRSAGLLSPSVSLQDYQTALMSDNIFRTMGSLISLSGNAGEIIKNAAAELFTKDGAFGAAGGNSESLVAGIGNAMQGLFGWGIKELGRLIVSIAIIYSLFKLLIQLLFAYLEIIFLVIIAPLWLLMDILPGGNSFFSWLRRLFANAMIFPATVFMIVLGIVIVGGSEQLQITPVLSDDLTGLSLPFLPATVSSLAPLLGIGFILIIPKVNDMVKGALKVSGNQYVSAIGQSVGVGMAGARSMTRPVTRASGFGANWAKDNHITNTLEGLNKKENLTRTQRVKRSIYKRLDEQTRNHFK